MDLMARHLIIQDQVKIIIMLTQSSAKSALYLDIEQTNARIGSILVLYLKSIMAEEGLNQLYGQNGRGFGPRPFPGNGRGFNDQFNGRGYNSETTGYQGNMILLNLHSLFIFLLLNLLVI